MSGTRSAARHLFQWFNLALILGLAGLSVAGAFLGADRAARFFNSPPMIALWVVLALALAAGFVAFARLRKNPGLLAIHLGCLLVILGSMRNSETAHRLRSPAAPHARVRWSHLRLHEGEESRALLDASLTNTVGELAFNVRLERFRIDHYPSKPCDWRVGLGAMVRDEATGAYRWEAEEIALRPDGLTELADTGVRIRLGMGGRGLGGESTIELEAEWNGRAQSTTLAFPPGENQGMVQLTSLFPEATRLHRSVSLILERAPPAVRAYRSRVVLTDPGGRVRVADLSVNRPLKHGGYRLYQYSWGADPMPYTVLLVVSDAGLGLVYAGFALLAAGSALFGWRHCMRRTSAGSDPAVPQPGRRTEHGEEMP